MLQESEAGEKDKCVLEDVDMECETLLDTAGDHDGTLLDHVAAPADVLGLDTIVGLTPPPDNEAEMEEGYQAYSAGIDQSEHFFKTNQNTLI